LAELAEQETAIRMDWIRSHPSKRSDGVGTPVSAIRREIDQKARKRPLLAADIAAQERILVDLEREAGCGAGGGRAARCGRDEG
jgi:hypothetical protein